MNINDLRIFIALAEYENFTRAATATNTVQSNVSARIKALEKSLNTKLLYRTTRSVTLTPQGIDFLKIAREITMAIDNFKFSIHKQEGLNGQVRLGCIHSAATLRASSVLEKFIRDYPDVDFTLKTGTTSDLIAQVTEYKLDGAFVTGPVRHPDLDTQTIVFEELHIVLASGTPDPETLIRGDKPVKLAVFNRGCSYRDLLTHFLNTTPAGIKYIETDTLENILNVVENGTAITLLPKELITRHYPFRKLRTIPLPESHAKIPTVFIKRKDFPMSHAYSLFFDSVINGYG